MKRSFILRKNFLLISPFCFLMFTVSACSNNLSRGKAEQMIKANISPLSVAFVDAGFMGFTTNIWDNTLSPAQKKQLKDDGYLLTNGFSEKAKPFVTVKKEDGVLGKTDFYYLQLAIVDKIIVNGISQPADLFGHRVCEAKYEIKYKPNALGEKLKIEPDKLKKTGNALFVLTDNGWELDKL